MTTQTFAESFFPVDKLAQILMELETAEACFFDDVTLIWILDDAYPALLREIYEAPPIYFVKEILIYYNNKQLPSLVQGR